MRKHPILLALLLLAALPLLDHADQATCANCTTSLASTINNPVAGDESFFKLPSGPSNVMFLLDTSGSMLNFPQCGDDNWDASGVSSTCASPSTGAFASLADPTSSTASPTYTVTGTCTPATDGLTSTASNLAWMEAVTPQTGYADPGRTNALLWDCPPWGNGGAACGTKVCSGSGCLFDPNAYYTYGDWASSGGGTNGWYPTTTRRALEGTVANGTNEPTAPCIALDGSGNVITDYKSGNPVDLGAACSSCMASRGFYIYKIKYYYKSGNKAVVGSVTQPLFRGTFLNANPPKFVTAKQVLKSVAWMDPTAPSVLDQIRLGLSILDSGGTSPRKAQLIVPLGPDKSGSYPPTQQGFRQSRQYILSVLNYDATKYTDSSGGVIVDGTTTGSSGFQNGFFNPASGSTPLASALLNVGQYFTTVSPSLYSAKFGNNCGGGTCVTSEFNETAAGRSNAAWVTKSGNTQCSICWGCQASSIILITDGSPNSEITLPGSSASTNLQSFDNPGYSMTSNCAGTYAAGASVPGTDTTFKCASPSDSSKASGLPRVADWLHSQAANGKLAPAGLRYDLQLGGGQKALTVDTIGINIVDKSARSILRATANLSGGIYQNAKDPQTLAQAVYASVNRVAPKAISFSSASSSSLQTVQTSASQAYITRFRPNELNAWEGHVFQAFLFDEFSAGCDPKDLSKMVTCAQSPSGKKVLADFNQDGMCGGTYLTDLDCDEVVEDTSTGNFLKKGTTKAANLPWDAGQVLSYETFPSPGPPTPGANAAYRSADETSANARTIFTWIGGQRVDLTSANAATIQPYLNISSAWCTNFLTQLGVSGGSNPTLECAKQIIYYARGWDVLDQDSDGCGGPGRPTNTASCQRGTKGEERDRPMDAAYATTSGTAFFWKLGDISHSSPAVLKSPIAESVCATGYDKQCTWAIYSPAQLPNQTPMDTGCNKSDCYQDWRTANLTRQRVVFVGANDGMLHAFDAGVSPPRAGVAGPVPDSTGDPSYDLGTGAELWAFVPPDLLPRLKDLMSAHQYMVDGSVMLRDIWVDGSRASDGQNTPSAPSGADGVKQLKEFHSVVVFGRRSGGNQYSALDVTDPSKPTFLWNFPQGGSDDSRYMGESWGDFAPRAPPIGPVKLAPTASSPAKDVNRGFSERWVAMFGGGYDPTLTLGRAVFAVDAWTGATIWRFTDDDFKSSLSFSGASAPSMFPVTAVAMLDVGNPMTGTWDTDGFYDTVNWGDLGGNLFVARMLAPGVVDNTGRVNNWFAARAFEQLRRADDAQYMTGSGGVARGEFFYMTANMYDPAVLGVRTFLGSGNREQLMTQNAACGTDNLLGCCQAGCTNVTATSSENYGSCSHSDTFSCVAGLLTHTTSNSCPTSGATCAASPGNTYFGQVNVSFTCPGATATSASGTAYFDGSGLGTVAPVGTVAVNGTFAAPAHKRFYSVVTYGKNDAKQFSDKTTAKVFDQNRFTDVPYAGSCAGFTCTLVNTTQATVGFNPNNPTDITAPVCADGSAKCQASQWDPGWYYEFGDVCPLASCPAAPPWTDEKTGSAAIINFGCAQWTGFRPYGVSTSTDPCSGSQGAPTVYDYSLDAVSGTPTFSCSGDQVVTGTTGKLYAASSRSITAAPGGLQARMALDAQGNMNYETGHNDSGPGGTGSQTVGARAVAGSSLYRLNVPQQLHDCRHVSSASCR